MGVINFNYNELHDGRVYATDKDRVYEKYYKNLEYLLDEMNDDFKKDLYNINFGNGMEKIKYDKMFEIKSQDGYYSGDAFSIEMPSYIVTLDYKTNLSEFLSNVKKDDDKKDKSYIYSKDLYKQLFKKYIIDNLEMYYNQKENMNIYDEIEELANNKLKKLQNTVEKYDYFLKKLASELGYKEITPGWVENDIKLNKVEGWDESFENMYREYVNDILEYNIVEDEYQDKYQDEYEDEIENEFEYDEKNAKSDIIKYLKNPTLKNDSEDLSLRFLKHYVEKMMLKKYTTEDYVKRCIIKEDIERYINEVKYSGKETFMILDKDVDLIKDELFNKIDEMRKDNIKIDIIISSLETKYNDYDVINEKDLDKLETNLIELKNNIKTIRDEITNCFDRDKNKQRLDLSGNVRNVADLNIFYETLNLIDKIKNEKSTQDITLRQIGERIKTSIYEMTQNDFHNLKDLDYVTHRLEVDIPTFINSKPYIKIRDDYTEKEIKQYEDIANSISESIDYAISNTIDNNLNRFIEKNEIMKELKDVADKKVRLTR